ncbi:hypothetical protein SD72_15330 [Leucobacter komagatae]|uniref:Uncharacterized protein n=1 Tax=Leucobacter komagatae TaxID=55969 RepID=A0A0D0IPK0_9MICO|nr:hypothetical protein SD72_15330 [Leucobacter komagatae]
MRVRGRNRSRSPVDAAQQWAPELRFSVGFAQLGNADVPPSGRVEPGDARAQLPLTSPLTLSLREAS